MKLDRGVMGHILALAMMMLLVAWLSPPPDPTDQAMMEYVGAHVLAPGCADLNCFRILVPAALESLPGPSLPRWRAYAVAANLGGAVATAWLALVLGLPWRVAICSMWLMGLGAGTFATIHHPYNADPLVLALAPCTLALLLTRRTQAAVAVSVAGIFAKEFAAVPLFLEAGATALRRDWRAALHYAALALAVFAIWSVWQIGLHALFDYSYNDNPSVRLSEGGYFGFWLSHVTPATGAAAIFGAYGALYLLMPQGWRLAPSELRRLVLAAVPAVVAFVYVATPERALWNFAFLLVPMAAVTLSSLPVWPSAAFIAAYGFANLRIGGQLQGVPSSRYALLLTVVLAAVAIWRTAQASDEASA